MNLAFLQPNHLSKNMYIRFVTSSQIKRGLKFDKTCCGLWTVVCGRLSATSKAYF